MVVFIAGGAGYIGSHIAVDLLNGGFDVVIADNFVNSVPEALNRVKRLTGRDFPFYECDVRDGAALDRIFTENKIDAVIHMAGLKAVGESVSMPIEYYSNNLNSTVVLCEAMKRHGIKNIIFSSSATVYSGENDMPLTEGSNIGSCINPYAWTKVMNEQILRDIAHANPDWCVVLLRYFNPVGAHESGEIGEDPAGIPNNLLPYITQTAVGRREVLNVYGTDYPTPDGTCIRDYIHVDDLARGHSSALKYCENNTGLEVFNLSTGKGTSVLEMVAAFEEATGLRLPVKNAPRRGGDLPVSYASAEKAERILGWSAKKTVLDGCRDSWHWQKKNPTGFKLHE
jgi:UDP-glucose 4-epimerase